MRRLFAVMFIWVMIAAACTTSEGGPTAESGPRLVNEETLPPPSVTPLRLFTATTMPESAAFVTVTPIRNETRVGFFLETPTPPNTPTPTITDTPTRTPTLTPTRTATPTRTNTPLPTATFTPSLTPSITPIPSATSESVVIAQGTLGSGGGECAFAWFFTPAPSACPLTSVVTSPAAFQQMERGFMIWAQNGQTIFVLYQDSGSPTWLFAPDTFVDGEFLSNGGFIPPPGLLMPQRGFGKLWLNDDSVRARLGWAASQEVGYSAMIQAEMVTGTRYVSGPDGEVYILENDGAGWQRLR